MQPKTENYRGEFGEQVSQLLRSRRTTKVLCLTNPQSPIEFPHDDEQRLNEQVMESIGDAGYAPFHYPRNVDGIAEPWRFYFVEQHTCREIGKKLSGWFPDMRPNNKLPAMLRACGCLVLITWLPQFDGSESDDKQRQVNEEHLAATAAATQNLLLSLTAKNFGTYWSSGGFFRTSEMFARLDIGENERLLSAIFVDYGAEAASVEVIPGKQHANRSEVKRWTRVVNID